MLERKKYGCTEWDMAWFCAGCGEMKPWDKAAYMDTLTKKCYCFECSQKSPLPIYKPPRYHR